MYSYDCYGHGKAEPEDEESRYLISNFWDLVDDMEDFTNQVWPDKCNLAKLPRQWESCKERCRL